MYAIRSYYVIEMETFVAIMGCSQAIYVGFVPSQRVEDFIRELNKALKFFGGVPTTIVTDNLKSSVIRYDKYEPNINSSMEGFCAHYGTYCDPARPMSPRDKALVENAMNIVYREVYFPLRDRTFFSLSDLNRAAHEPLEKINRRNP